MIAREVNIQFKKLDPEAKLPEQQHPGDAGMDLYANEDVMIYPRKYNEVGVDRGVAVVDCGFALLPPENTRITFSLDPLYAKRGIIAAIDNQESGLKITLLNMGISILNLTKSSVLGKLYVQECLVTKLSNESV